MPTPETPPPTTYDPPYLNGGHDLAAAIREIQNTAILSIEPKPVTLKVSDGKGGTTEVVALVLPAGGGMATVHPLLDLQRAGTAFAQEQRLLQAEGPDRRAGTAVHQALESFIEHANRFKAENSAVWADADRRVLYSVLDYHPAGATSPARWGKHRGAYSCPLSEAWKAWGGGAPMSLSQDAFAALLDRRDRELAAGKLPIGKEAPSPAALVTLAASLEVYSSAKAKRERDPSTGRVKISFTEEKGLSGDVAPPPFFLIHIPVFQDSEPRPHEVRLRVVVEDGAATFEVQIHAAGDVLRAAFGALLERVEAGTGLPVFIGTPE
jgi:hypothetical protein